MTAGTAGFSEKVQSATSPVPCPRKYCLSSSDQPAVAVLNWRRLSVFSSDTFARFVALTITLEPAVTIKFGDGWDGWGCRFTGTAAATAPVVGGVSRSKPGGGNC